MNIEALADGLLKTGKAKSREDAHRQATEIIVAAGGVLPADDKAAIPESAPKKFVPDLRERVVKSAPLVFAAIGEAFKNMYASTPTYRGPVCVVRFNGYTVTGRVDSNGKVKLCFRHDAVKGRIPEVEFSDRMLAKIMHNPTQAALASYASTMLPNDPRFLVPVQMGVGQNTKKWVVNDNRIREILDKDTTEFEDDTGKRVRFKPETDEDGIDGDGDDPIQ